MQTRFIVLLGLVSASAAAALVSACGGSDNTATDGGDATTSDAQTSDVVGNDVANNDANPPGNDAGCQKGAGCRACCANAYPDGAAFFNDTEKTCACTTPGDCKAQSVCGGSLCNGQKASAACDICLGSADAGDCFAAAVAACANNAECQQLAGCVASCGSFDAGGGG